MTNTPPFDPVLTERQSLALADLEDTIQRSGGTIGFKYMDDRSVFYVTENAARFSLVWAIRPNGSVRLT